MPNPPGYFERYYEENRDKINKKRKRKYHGDPEYRENVLQASRDYRSRKRKENSEGVLDRPVGLRRLQRFQSVVDRRVGDGNTIKLMSVGAFAQLLGRSIQSVNHWEKDGVLPCTPYRDSRGFRYYTLGMMEIVKRWVKGRKRLFPVDPKMFANIQRGWEALGVPLAANIHPHKDHRYDDALAKTVVLTRRVMVGDGSMIRLFPAKSLAIFLGSTINAVRKWEREGMLPRTPYQDGGETYYTWEMMEAVHEMEVVDSKEVGALWKAAGVPLKAQSWRRALALSCSQKEE